MRWRSLGASALALVTLAIVAAPAAGQIVKPRPTSLDGEPDATEVLIASPTSVAVTPGGVAQTITVTSSYAGELSTVRFLLNGVASTSLTSQWGAATDAGRVLSVQAAASAVAGTYTVQAQRGTSWLRLPSTVTVAQPAAVVGAKAPASTTAPRGRYRVVLTGGRVHHETIDHLLNLDGWKDEVYFTVDVQLLDKVSGAIAPFMTLGDRTKIYGDIGKDPTLRVKAGTGSPFATGGLHAGDQFPAEGPFSTKSAFVDQQLPLRLWEGDLVQGQNAVIITPALWEWDGAAYAAALTGWMNFAKDFTTSLANNGAIDRLVAGTGSGVAGMLIDVAPLVPTLVLGITSNFGSDGDRMIGATIDGDKVVYKPQSIVLNYDRIEQLLSSDVLVGNAPKGFYPIAFREPMSNKLEGDYTLYLQIQRIP